MTTGYQSVALGNFYSDRDPTSSETDVDSIISQINDAGIDSSIQTYMWWNKTDNTFWRLVNPTSGSLVWQKTLSEAD